MTTIGQLKHIIEWKIPCFSSLSNKNTTCYWSSTFSFCNEIWYLELCPNGYTTESVGYISLFLRKKSAGPAVKIKFSLGLKEFSGQKFLVKLCEHIFEGGQGYGFQKFLLRSLLFEKKTNLIPGDVITVFCSIKSPTCVETSDVEKVSTEKCHLCGKIVDADNLSIHQKKDNLVKCADCSAILTLQNWCDHQCSAEATGCQSNTALSKNYLAESSKILRDFKELFLKQKECDVVIRVKDQEFSAHKAILVARSSVFESTFRNNMKERKSGTIDIEDCDPFSFPDFLGHLYCGDSNISEENVFNLFVTADKYDVQDLKIKCMEFIKNNISVDTFCDAISLALQYSETELIKLATDFFATNLQEIIVTIKWQSFLAENPTQSNELLIKALVAKNKSVE